MGRRTVHIVFLTLLACSLQGQISVTGGFTTDSIEIGEEVDFTLTIRTNIEKQILAIPTTFIDTIYSALQSFKVAGPDTANLEPVKADYDVLDLGTWNDQNDDGLFAGAEISWEETAVGREILREHTFRFRFWDPGQILVLLPPVLYTEDDEQKQHYEGGRATIFVTPPASLKGISADSLSIAPIKPILVEPTNISDYLIYLYILIGILATILGYYIYQRMNRRLEEGIEVIVPDVYVPPHVKALTKLSTLREEELWQKGEIKGYQSQLTHIIREYLVDRFSIKALERTTDEITKTLRNSVLTEGQTSALVRILQVADLVKFAKAKPETSIHDEFMGEAVAFVNDTRPLQKTKEEADD